METFYISCEPKNARQLVELTKGFDGYKSLGQHEKTKAIVFSVCFEGGIFALFSIVRHLYSRVSRSNPLEK